MSVQVHKVVVRVERPVNEIRAYRANSSFFFLFGFTYMDLVLEFLRQGLNMEPSLVILVQVCDYISLCI